MTSLRLLVGAMLLCMCTANSSAQEQKTTAPARSQPSLADIQQQITALTLLVEDLRSGLKATNPAYATRNANTEPARNINVLLPFIPEEQLHSESSKYVLIEFRDPQCPYCISFEKDLFPQVEETMLKPGFLSFASVEFPLASHPGSMELSLANICAGRQGRYSEMRAALSKSKLPINLRIEEAAIALRLEPTAFSACRALQTEKDNLVARTNQLQALGVEATPTFLIGKLEPGGIRGTLIVGAVGADALRTAFVHEKSVQK